MRMCEENISHIHMLVEEELEAQAAERLREHMSDCQDCSQQFEEFRQMKNLGEEALSAELGDVDIADGFLKKLSESATAKRRPGSFMRWAWIPLAVAATVILVVIASSIFRPGPTGPESLARLTHVSIDGGAWEKSETEVLLGMTKVVTRPSERLSLRLETGVIVFLNGDTALEVQSPNALRLRRGEIFVDTAGRKADAAMGALLRVETDHATTIVTGTRFGVSADEKQTSVAVEEGAVTVESAWGEQLVAGGSIFRVIENLEPEPPEPVDVEQAFAWIAERAHLAEKITGSNDAGRERFPVVEVPIAEHPLEEREARYEKDSSDSDRYDLSLSVPEPPPADIEPEISEELRKKLRKYVAFEFECEPLRKILTFLNAITGVKIFAAEEIFEKLGQDEDCYGNPVTQKEMFITVHVKELPLEIALEGMLRQYGLGYIIEDDHILITFQNKASDSTPKMVSDQDRAEARDEVWEELLQPVAFEFMCEPLRDVIRFLTTITGLNILIDEDVFEELGQYEDCYGNLVDRKEVFITVHVNEIPLESVLNGMLRQHDLGYSIDDGYIYISAQSGLPEANPQEASAGKQAEAIDEVRELLSQLVAFDFECEPLRDVIRFLTTITGLNILIDEDVFEEFGQYEDCYGNLVGRKELFITVHASEIPLENILDGMLRQHDLAYSIEPGYIYISDDLSEPSPRATSVNEQVEAKDKIHRALSRPVPDSEFKCEFLRSALKFLTTVTGVNIIADEDIFEQLGSYEDCDGTPIDRKSLFVTFTASEATLESTLNGILGQLDLKFSVEPYYIYISSLHDLPKRTPRSLSAKKRLTTEEEIRKALLEPVAFGFECEPLTAVMRFFTASTGVKIFLDRDISMELGQMEDCYGNPMKRKEIFITYPASQMLFETALSVILEPYGLRFSVEYTHISVSRIGEPKEQDTEPETFIREAWQPVEPDTSGAGEAGWPEIEVKSVFDATRSKSFIAIIEVNGRRMFIKTGQSLGDFEVISIDDESKCVTLAPSGQRGVEQREFCVER